MGKKKATWWEFCDISLYEEQKYTLRDMDYYLWSELKQEYQKYHTTPALTYEYLKQFETILYVDE